MDTGIEMLVAHPHDAKMITQTKYKDDKIDAERLAEMSRIGVVPASYIPTKKDRDRRKLTRSRHGLKNNINTYKNRIEAAIATYPLKRPTGDLYSGRGRTWLETAPFREADRAAIDVNLDIIDTIIGQADRFGKVIAKKALNDPDVQKIMTLTGMGHILALTVMAEIVDIRRFATPEKLVSYAGLAPSRHDSGNRAQTGGITKRGSAWLRTAMVEAAFRGRPARPAAEGHLRAHRRAPRTHEGQGRHSTAHAGLHPPHVDRAGGLPASRQGPRQTETPEDTARSRTSAVADHRRR